MGDHFVLLVDRLLTESTLEAAIESRNRSSQAAARSTNDDNTKALGSSTMMDLSSPSKMVECRICQDEDEDSNMETPCSCCGSLEYAHRRCVQRWCNEKGNTTCEICHQQFKPGYTAPAAPAVFRIGGIPMNLRANWDIYGREFNDSRLIAVVSTDRRYDEYSVPTTRSSTWYRTVAIVFMLLLILRHTLPFVVSITDEYAFPLFALLLLPTVGIILPVYLMVKATDAVLRHRRRQQGTPNSLFAQSDEDAEPSFMQTQPHMINVH